MQRMKGKVVFVAGGNQGIGRETVELLAAEGAHVVTCARRAGPLEDVKKAVEAKGGSIETIVLDVGELEALEAAILDIAARHGRLDGLVHNAVIAEYKLMEDVTIADWRRLNAVNLDAYFVSNKTAMKVMREQGGGAIVNLCSAVSFLAMARGTAYCTAKAAVLQLTRMGAVEGGPHNVRVNGVAPGFLVGEGQHDRWAPEHMALIAEHTPMRRTGLSRDGAQAILFLLSEEASYISGACLPVDGGKLAELFVPKMRAD